MSRLDFPSNNITKAKKIPQKYNNPPKKSFSSPEKSCPKQPPTQTTASFLGTGFAPRAHPSSVKRGRNESFPVQGEPMDRASCLKWSACGPGLEVFHEDTWVVPPLFNHHN